MIEDLIRLAETASKAILGYTSTSNSSQLDNSQSLNHVRVISHNDADGISSAAIICTALLRCNLPFQASFVNRFEGTTLDRISSTDSDLVILCDMGSGQSELVKQIKKPVIILDHHKPSGEHDCVHVNPHLVGLDGAFELSASGVAYFVARLMGENTDLSSLAILGAIGDKQSMQAGANKFILDEAVSCGSVELSRGLLLEGDLKTALSNTFEPYFDFSGDEGEADKFLSELNLPGNTRDIDAGGARKLASALVLKMLKRECVEAVDSIIGEKYCFKDELIKNAYNLASVVNTCGKLEESGVGLSICMRDKNSLEYALELDRKNKQSLISTMKTAEQALQEKEHLRYVILHDSTGTGAVAGTMTRYLFPDKPFIAINITPEIIKISGRGTKKLVSQGLDLASSMKNAAREVGGEGGGHTIASGASIPHGAEEKFIALLNNLIGQQLGTNHD